MFSASASVWQEMFSVGVIAPAFHRSAVHRTRARAGKHVRRRKSGFVPLFPFFEIRRRSDDFERGTGLVNIADDTISGKRVQQRNIVPRDVVQIVRRRARHGENFKRIGIEHDTFRAFRGILLRDAPERRFRRRLDACVDCKAKIITVFGGFVRRGGAVQAKPDKIGFV